MRRNVLSTAIATYILLCALPALILAQRATYNESNYYFYEPGSLKKSTLYLDGSVIELETGSVTVPLSVAIFRISHHPNSSQ